MGYPRSKPGERTFTNMRQAAALIGVELSDIRFAKKLKCTAFRGSGRIKEQDLRLFLAAFEILPPRCAKSRVSFE